METPRPEIKTHNEVLARQCYPNRETLVAQFNKLVDSGDLSLVPTALEHSTVSVTTWDFTDKYPTIDFSYLASGVSYDYDDVLAGIPKDQWADFIAQEDDKLRKSCFQVDISQRARAWWVGINEDIEFSPWLDSATLHSIHEVRVGEASFLINDFSGKVDIETIVKGIGDIAQMLEEHGLNLGQLFNVLNIQPEDFADFEVPAHIKEKDPKLFVAATANKMRGILTFNEKTFIGREFHEEDKGFVAANGWGPTFVHEFGHFLNMGLSDMSDTSFARDIGWAARRDVANDDYGTQHDIVMKHRMPGWGDYVTDDMGEQVFVSASKLAKILVEGYTDNTGKTVTPPSEYGATNDAEDIAESFAAYFYAPEKIDETRRAMVERLIASKATDTNGSQEVRIRALDIKSFDPWETVLPKEIRYTRTYTGPYKRPS